MDRLGLGLDAVYGGLDLDTGAGLERLEATIHRLKGRPTILWVTLTCQGVRPSSTDGDGAAVALLRPLAAMARKDGVRLAIYPHAGFWVERFSDAIRVADLVDRPDLGVTFNLCHFLMTERGADLDALLKAAGPRLFVATINGADRDGRDWGRLIQTLDRGDFDAKALVAKLRAAGFAGPIGLQGYGIPGDHRANLERSMKAWKAMAHAR